MVLPPPLRITEGEGRVYKRVWRGSVVTSFLNPVLYLLAMGVGLGSLVDQNNSAGVEGLSYLTYLAPGLLAATGMQTGAAEGSFKVMAGIKWQRTYEARLATPITVTDLVLGHLGWTLVRLFMVCGVFALVMAIFQVTTPLQALLAVPPAVLVGIAVAAPVTALTASLENPNGLNMLFRFGVIPMFLFSGTFFPITQLPDWMQPIAFATPLFHGVELTRWITLGITPAVSPAISVTYLLAWLLVGTLLAVRQFRRRLRT